MSFSTAISSYELSLGEYLSAYSESELTYAGSIMKKTGELHEQHAKMRSVCIGLYTIHACTLNIMHFLE